MNIKLLTGFLAITMLGAACTKKAKQPEDKRIRFDFTMEKEAAAGEIVLLHATLYNDGTDTACFLTSSCAGEHYSLRYDTSFFDAHPLLLCNASFPEIKCIPPKDKLTFKAWLRG